MGTPSSSASGTEFHIVFVDDDTSTCKYVEQILAPLGRVQTCQDGHDALSTVQRELPDLLVTDVRMPGLDGFALLRALRDDERTKTLPVIMLSGRGDDESRLLGLTSGADDYLVKPFSAQELFARVRSALMLWQERKRALADLQAAHEQLESLVQARTRELGDALNSLRLEMAEHHSTEAARIALLRRLVKAQEDERRRIARDLHDHMGQQLTALRHQLEALEQCSATEPPSPARIQHTLGIARQIEADIDFLAWERRCSTTSGCGRHSPTTSSAGPRTSASRPFCTRAGSTPGGHRRRSRPTSFAWPKRPCTTCPSTRGGLASMCCSIGVVASSCSSSRTTASGSIRARASRRIAAWGSTGCGSARH